ncbi:hypothetical protein [uncultured Methylobacterium sp.]|jgi:hypothetical protein|uniref:hypothetical protein n=1 Tax=uncultured Methylobacterium sp. TaxID=157278 RepID=UPI00262812E0|nr:hypothetical protein [uncultured Methylobacterium sp.]
MSSLAAAATQMMGSAVNQQVGTAVLRQQFASQRAVADLVAQTAASAAPPAPAGQGQVVDRRV